MKLFLNASRKNSTFERDYYSEYDLSEEELSLILKDPRFCRDQFGFHRRMSEKELKKKSDDELNHLIRSSDNDLDVVSAKDELNRRKSLREHNLNLLYNILGGIIGGVITVAIQYVFRFLARH